MYDDERVARVARELGLPPDQVRDDFEKLSARGVEPEDAERTITGCRGPDGPEVFDLDGVGVVRGHFLVAAGYEDAATLAVVSPEVLADIPWLGATSAATIVAAANERVADSQGTETRPSPDDGGSETPAHERPVLTGADLVRATDPVSRDDDYPGTCGFVFDPESWDGTDGRRVTFDLDPFDDGVWHCPHEVPEGETYCLFHQLPGDKDGRAVREAFLDVVCSETDHAVGKQFVGACFDELDLGGTVIDPADNHPVVLQHASFEGGLRLSDARVTNELRLSHSRLGDGATLSEATFDGGFEMYGAHVDSVFEAKKVDFTGRPLFGRTTFEYGVRFDGARFGAGAIFSKARFRSYVTFDDAHFDGPATFLGTRFDYRVGFERAVFERAVGFSGARFHLDEERGYVPRFVRATFHGPAVFGNSDRYDSLPPAAFVQRPTFEGARFEDRATFRGCALIDGVDLRVESANGRVALDEVIVADTVDCRGASLNGTVSLHPHCTGSTPVSLRGEGATIRNGSVGGPTHGTLYADLTDAIVGDVAFEDSEGNRTLARTRFLRTRFDGFDFTAYRPELDRDWTLHTFEGAPTPSALARPSPDPTALELTYLRAKSGANRTGDGRAASGFFQHEMQARRGRYRRQARHAAGVVERGRAAGRWLFNLGFDATCRYGESPRKTLRTVIGIVVVFAALYWLAFSLLGADPPYGAMGWPTPVAYVVFSAESFVSLVNSPSAQLSRWPLRLLSVSQGFVGAFTIALFLFTLTRYVHR